MNKGNEWTLIAAGMALGAVLVCGGVVLSFVQSLSGFVSRIEFGNVAEWFGAIATFLAVVMAIYGEHVLRFALGPRGHCTLGYVPPRYGFGTGGKYFNLGFCISGGRAATNVSCVVRGLQSDFGHGGWEQFAHFTFRLCWCEDGSSTFPKISPKEPEQMLHLGIASENRNSTYSVFKVGDHTLGEGKHLILLTVISDQGVLFEGSIEFEVSTAAMGADVDFKRCTATKGTIHMVLPSGEKVEK
jgi:hypothetical protein